MYRMLQIYFRLPRDDVLGLHASLFRQVALDAAPQARPLGTALSALSTARALFDATRLWADPRADAMTWLAWYDPGATPPWPTAAASPHPPRLPGSPRESAGTWSACHPVWPWGLAVI
jgi:hypothetical protein